MITVKIIGGLGNQLFQYAAGRSLALKHNTSLLLDTAAFDEYKLRNFELQAFQAKIEFVKPISIKMINNRSLIDKVKDRVFPLSMRKLYREPHFHFDKNFFSAPDNVYLKGYWQSEKYFLPVKDFIRKDFSFKETFISKVTGYADQIRNAETVSVHIRRGDFTNKEIQEIHGILPLGYYENSIQFIRQKFPHTKLLIFSDDIDWVKENLKIENAVFVSGEISKNHFEDLYLMSQCKHNIIANSSFSWWAAWLNNNPDKIVIAPKKWFNKGPKDTQDLIPESWITI